MAKRTRTVPLRESQATPLVEREFSAGQRKKMAGSGAAMSDGSFPIPDEDALKRAIQSIGRAKDPAATRRHIIKRARALGLTKLLPDDWASNLTEAERSIMDRYTAVCRAIEAKYAPTPGLMPADECSPRCWVRDIFDTYAVVQKGDELYRIDYTIADDGTVELAEPVAVEIAYQPVKEAETSTRPAPATGADPSLDGAPVEISESSSVILEAKSPKGNAWDVLLIKAGTSGNQRHYPASVLEAAVPLFEGARAYADHPTRDEQRNRPERSIRDVVGWFEGVGWDTEHQGIRGTFKILESADWLRAALKSAWDQGKKDLLGFSINALGRVGSKRADNSVLIEAIEKVVSTDVVTTPGAGGRLLGVLESERSAGTSPEGEMKPEEIQKMIAEALAASAQQMQTGLLEAMKAELTTAIAGLKPAAGGETSVVVKEADPPKADEPSPELVEMREALATIKRQERAGAIRDTIREAKLPDLMAKRVEKRLLEALDRRSVEDDEVTAAIQEARDIIADLGHARVTWPVNVQAGDSPHDKMRTALMGWFKGEAIDGVTPVRDLKESYARWTNTDYLDVGPWDFWGAFQGQYDSGRDHAKIQESLTTSGWNQLFADVLYLMMIKEYEANPDHNQWRKLVSQLENVPDFRTRHWARVGGYGDFSSVAEQGTYPTLTTPGDEEITYALSKYGGIDDVTMETLLGDRVNKVRALPRAMAYAASRTLHKFVMNLITTDNPTMDYDSTTLYHANHGNTGTTALSVAGLNTTQVAMRDQTPFGQSDDLLGSRNKIKLLIVPNELEARADRIINPSELYAYALSSTPDADTSIDPMHFKGKGIELIVHDYLTDATDWWAVADPNVSPVMVMGFLNGMQQPELFTQDQPNVGSVFTADKISFKCRFIFGGDMLDHRGVYRQVVS